MFPDDMGDPEESYEGGFSMSFTSHAVHSFPILAHRDEWFPRGLSFEKNVKPKRHQLLKYHALGSPFRGGQGVLLSTFLPNPCTYPSVPCARNQPGTELTWTLPHCHTGSRMARPPCNFRAPTGVPCPPTGCQVVAESDLSCCCCTLTELDGT